MQERKQIYTAVKVGASSVVVVVKISKSFSEGATIDYSIIDSDVSVAKGARVGRPRDIAEGITVIGANNVVGDGEDIADNQMIYSE